MIPGGGGTCRPVLRRGYISHIVKMLNFLKLLFSNDIHRSDKLSIYNDDKEKYIKIVNFMTARIETVVLERGRIGDIVKILNFTS